MGVAVRNEGSKINGNINVTPMVDVMLVLLIIFMVITPMLQNKVAVDMAKVDNPTSMPDADKEDAIVVAITRDGGVFLGQDKVATSELGVKVRDKLADKPGKVGLLENGPEFDDIGAFHRTVVYPVAFDSISVPVCRTRCANQYRVEVHRYVLGAE